VADYFYSLGMGCGIALGQILWIKALQLDKAGRCASMTMLNIVFAYAFDILFFSYSISLIELSGAALIVGCSALVFILKLYVYKEN